jgi:outer membrane receptor for monomeric catechols
MVTLSAAQLTALCRFNREFNVRDVRFSQVDENEVVVTATLRGGKQLISRQFTLNREGKLVKNETSESPT